MNQHDVLDGGGDGRMRAECGGGQGEAAAIWRTWEKRFIFILQKEDRVGTVGYRQASCSVDEVILLVGRVVCKKKSRLEKSISGR
ncbi:hypothetical protein PL79_009685 [Burkholderia sp. USMB20]|nr:hypothetical protein PL79_009685 [Burkholderia sp. USMB20]